MPIQKTKFVMSKAQPTERFNRMVATWNPTTVNPISAQAQSNYAAILSNSSNANNAAVQLLAQLMPAGQFQVLGVPLYAGVNGTERTATRNDYREWQPRAGFAYRIGPHTVFRGGFGRFAQADYITGSQSGFSRLARLRTS